MQDLKLLVRRNYLVEAGDIKDVSFQQVDFLRKISKKDEQPFWLAGIWNRWMSPDGSELESCCVLTTKPNELVKPLHNRMPVIIPNGLEEEWTSSAKDGFELGALEPIMAGWSPFEWKVEPLNKHLISQMSLF